MIMSSKVVFRTLQGFVDIPLCNKCLVPFPLFIKCVLPHSMQLDNFGSSDLMKHGFSFSN
eukprot:m.986536 g.986536  ORF g.986536 m.986536 type:complete len:60 (+) comp23990_c0_seq5:664-843(+)